MRGPSFPARRVIGQVNQALLLPPLPIVGDYQLDNIRLVRAEGTNTITLQEGSPSSVPIRVFDEVLVSRVTSRPLTLEEIREKGIVIDDQNFRAVEFEIGFVLDGKTIPVRFPVVAPAFRGNTEIIPAAELEKRLAEAEAINNQIDLGAVLPPELETARLNIDINGINFQFTEDTEVDLALQVPPIPALMVIPGNIGFLNQFFSVQIFTENAAPAGSGLSVINVQALLKLPPGPDLLVSTNYNAPGDDPLRFARVGSDRIIQPVQPVVRAGADGQTGTSDDIPRLLPGETGTGEFLVEGLQEGLHVMDLDLTADLEGLAAGIVKIKGKAAGSVLVRNPKFSLAFSHPRTVRAGEPYDLYVSVLNTSSSVANLVQVAMAAASISGGNLESAETVVLGTILPGQTLTAKFRIRATRTGAISFSNLTTSDDSLVGRFRLRGGFDERGVALSPDTIGMPDYVTNLPPALLDAANRVLGQALSVATAGQLPAGVKSIGKSVVTRRVLELAEAGQRVQYGDPLPRVLADILLDWQGGRSFSAGFDQIVRETDAGREWREAVALHQELADGLNAITRLAARLPDLAGRGEPWAIFAIDSEAGAVRFGDFAPLTPALSPPRGEGEVLAPRYDHTNAPSGFWLVDRPGTNLVFEWRPDVAVPAAELALALLETNGTVQHLRWSVANVPARACLRFDAGDPSGQLRIDNNCDGTNESAVAASLSTVNELPPTMVSVRQDPSVLAGRPFKLCAPPLPSFPLNYATVVAVLFSKPMTQDRINVPSAYTLENGNEAGSVQIQPGGRVALLNMRQPVGGLRERMMTVNGVTDPRGNTLLSNALPVISNLRGGASIRGRVARADGSPAAAVPVTLTYYDQVSVGLGGCEPWIVRPGQVFTDEGGYFDFDLVVSGIPYSISATDTLGLSPEAIALILESTRADEFQRSKLLELATSASARNTLLADFAVGALTDVVAKAEGLDRALLRDLIPPGSGREGSVVPVALRFRGRGAVAGRVVLADGVTPVSRAAVNLFPDPASRELGRGLFSDSDGRFAFLGVPLGIFSIEANSGTGLTRTIAGVIELPGQTTNLLIVLSSAQVPRTDLTGRVTENDNVTPHAGATVYVGKFDGQGRFCCVVSAPTADSDGFWRAAGIPADTYVLMAVSQDGRRKGERRNITAPAGVTNFASIALQGFSVVIGRVETANGIPVVNAIVAGGEQLVRTTNNGTFRLTGVPTGLRTISAGAERSGTNQITSPPFSFPRLGSAGVNVLPGVENFVVIRFDPKGSLIGRVVDETGTNAVTGINVALPESGGFQWVPVNHRGEFFFEGIGLKKYVVSAPAPPVFNTDVSGILDRLGDPGSSEGELLAAIGEAFAIFTGAADPLLNGEGANFNPGRWGYIETELIGDGDVKNVTVQFFRSSTIAGKVLNGQGVPIGARVRLTGVGPALNGAPITVVRGERNSDPALGTFEFPRSAFIGSYGLQSASPFFPVVITHSGFTTEVQPDDTNVVLQFPATREISGRLAGFVFNPDGSPAAPGVKVRIRSFDGEPSTQTNGFFDTQIALPALTDGVPGRGYLVEAEDLVNASVGAASVIVYPGITNFMNIRLLGRGALRVTVLQNDGTPAAGARLGYDQGSYPSDRLPLNEGPVADENGQALFLNLFEGYYGVCARFVSGPTALNGRVGAGVATGQTNEVIIRLGPTGTIEGTFVKRDGVTPVTFAQVAVGNIGFATTDTNGFFRVSDMPLGTYRLTSSDPVSGIGATLTTVLSFNGQTNVVRLIEQSRGEIRGAVIASDGATFAPGVSVTLNVSDGITPSRTVTTGPDGRFNFPGAPAGPFQLFAEHPVTRLSGHNSATLPENAAFFEINVALQPLAAVTVVVLRPDGVTPATNATVQLGDLIADTDGAGRVTFSDVKLGTYMVTATSRTLSESRSFGRTNVTLAVPGQAPDAVVRLAGVGRVSGQVLLSNGSTPAVGAVVTLSHQGEFQRYTFNTTTDGNGQFSISNVAVGPYEVSARSGTLGSRVAGSIAFDGEADTVSLTVEPSGTVRGRLVRADGVTPVVNEDLNLTLPGRSLPGSLVRPGTNGLFEFTSLPLGLFRLQSTALRFNGIALREGTLTFNGQTNDVGNLVMDEDDPRVVIASPPDTAVGVPITTTVELVFNETLRSNTVDTTGVYLQGPSNTVAATVQLLNHSNGVGRLVRLTPLAPLRSLTTYRIVVVDNIRQDAFGAVIGRGPQDLVGRPLVAPFLATFTTADNDPPLLLSIFPTNGQIQIDPRAVMRLSFNEPVRETNFSLTLTGTNGLVPGTASVGLNGLVLAFAPAAELAPNTAYTLAVSNIFDLAGNRATNEPFVATFATLDTLGPEIAAFSIVSNRPPVAGSTVQVEALLAVNEPGVSIRFTQDLIGAGSDTNAPFRVNVTLPANGTTTVRAIAADRFGNDGPLAEFVIAVVSNEPPTVTLTRIDPATGPVFRSEPFTVRVSATDDASVTNITLTATGGLNLVTNISGSGPADVMFFVPFTTPTGSVITVTAQAADFAGLLSADASLDLVVSNLNHRPVTLAGASGAGGALRFDGVNDFVSVASSPSVNPTAAMTIEAWVFAENLNSGQIGIAGTWDDNAGGFRTYLLWILNGRLEFILAPSFARPGDSSTFPINRWVHVAATYDGAVVRLYRDGTNVASTASSGSIASNSRPFFIGRTEGGSNGPDFFPGSIDEVRLWNRALSPAEIAEQRSRVPTGNEPGLLGYWPFNETSGTTTADLTANNNIGTLGGGSAANQPARVASTAPIFGVAISTNTSLALLPLVLDGSDLDGDPITAVVTTLPAHGTLFQTADGVSPGAAITNVPATVTSATRTVILRRQPGFSGRDQFVYVIHDGLTNSADGLVQLDLLTPPGLDTDGDGMPDGFEFANGLNPELNDAALDADSDGLSNLGEFLAGSDPRNPDSDGDGLLDGTDPAPLDPADGLHPAMLTFNLAGIANFQSINQGYGDRVTNIVMGGFSYGGVNPLTPNVTVSYGTLAPALWTTGYGTLTNVLFEDADNTGVLTVTLAADAGFQSQLHGFKLAALTSGFTSDPVITSVQVLDASANVLFSSTNQIVSRTTFTPFNFSPVLANRVLTIRVDARNLGSLNDDIAIDDIRFSQSAEPICVPTPPGVVAWWRAEDNALDEAAAFDGTISGSVTFTNGPVGRAFHFSGGRVTVADSSALDLTTNMTLEGWIAPFVTGRVDQTGAVLWKGRISLPNAQPYGLLWSDTRRVFFSIGSASTFDRLGTVSALPLNKFTHVAATYDGETMRIYVNGLLESSKATSIRSLLNSAEPLRIGGDDVRTFLGAIDELTIYNRVLGSNEIAGIFAAGAAGKCPADRDTDGDGMPDVFEIAHALNPFENDASLDADSDGLNNLGELQAGTNPRNPDTDGDGLLDGADPNPLQPSTGTGLAITTYANVIDPIQLSFAPDGALYVGRDNFGSTSDPAHWDDPVKIHRVGPGGSPVTEYGNAALQDPDGVMFDAAGVISGTPGSVLVAGGNSALQGFIRAIKPDQSIDVVFGPMTSSGNPGTMKFDGNGRLLFLEPNTGQQGVWATTGGPPARLLPASLPIHLAVGADNRIYVSDQFSTLRSFAPDGTVINNSLATGLPAFYFDVAPGGFFGTNIWGVDSNGRLLEVNPVTGAITERATGLGNACYHATFGPDGAFYISQFDQDRILRVAPAGCAPLPVEAIAWWRAEDSFEDVIGGFDGSPANGAGFGAGQVARAFHFDGVDDFISVPDGPQWDFVQNDFTIELWVKLDRLKDSMFIHQQSGALQGGFEFDFQTDTADPAGSNILVFARNPADGLKRAWTPQTNLWYHLAVTHDSGNYRLFVDGIQLGGAEFSPSPVANVSGSIRIGSWAGGGFEVAGAIDEITIHGRALSSAELQQIILVGSAGKCAPVCAPLPSGAVAWWPGQDNPSDVVGTNNGALFNGVTFTNGVVGRAFHLDGVSARVAIADAPAFRFANGITMETWFRTAGTPDFSGLIKKFEQVAPDTTGFQLGFHGNAGRGTLRSDFGIGNTYLTVFNPKAVMDGVWHHAAVTWDGSQILLYVDGVPGQPGFATNVQVILNNTSPLILGFDSDSGGRHFNGDLDEVSLYNRALTAAEIQAIYLANLAGKCPPVCAPLPTGALAWWRAESNALDHVGPNHGVMNNGATFAPGKVGTAFLFDGVNDHVSIADSPLFSNLPQISFMVWFKFNALPAGKLQMILTKGRVAGRFSSSFWLFREDAPGRIIAGVETAAGLPGVSTPQAFNDTNQFHLAVVTYDGTQVTLYLDGASVSTNFTTGAIRTDSDPILIGRRNDPGVDGVGDVMNGLVDEVMVFNRALGSNEIAAIFAAGGQGVCAPSCLPMPTGMAAWWPGNNAPNDLIGGIPGALQNGASFTNAGRVGEAFRLDGVDDFVDIGPLAALDNATEITVAAWVNRQNTDNTVGGIVAKWDSTGDANTNTFLLYNGEIASANRGSFFVGFANGSHGFVNGTTLMNRDQWYHVAGTWRSSDGQLSIYKNGVPERIVTVGAGQQLRTHRAYTAKIGEWGIVRTSEFKWPGLIDEAVVFHRALGSNEIAAIYNAGSAGLCPPTCTPTPVGLVSWWRGESNALDHVGANHGTLAGSGAAFTNGVVGTGFRTTQSSLSVLVPHSSSLAITGAFTIEFWARWEGRFGGTIVSKYSTVSGRAGWYAEHLGDGRIGFHVDGDGIPFNGVEREIRTVDPVLPLGVFKHIAAVCDPATQTLKLFVDGTEVATTLTRGGNISQVFPTVEPLRISGNGSLQGGTTLRFEGTLDEVSLYNRALSAAEVLAAFNAGSAGKCLDGPGGGAGRSVELRFEASVRLIPGAAENQGAPQVLLNWSGAAESVFIVEASLDLVHWFEVTAVVRELAPGHYEGSVVPPDSGSCFFRVVLAPR